MLSSAMLHWRGEVILSRDLVLEGERTEFYKRVRAGEFTAILRSVFVRSDLWASSTPDGRYLLRVAGASAIAPGSVLSHDSAAAVWRLPNVGRWPRRVHVLQERSSPLESTSVYVRHTVGLPGETVEIDGVIVTTLARTVVDVAATWHFGAAVAVADAALRRTDHPFDGAPPTDLTRADLLSELGELPVRHGSARAGRVVRFADGAADRPGESLSRVGMQIAQIAPPLIQVTLRGLSGKEYIVDFWWPGFNMIGEFDGAAKYTDPRFLRGRTPERAFLDEKYREDDLRAAGYRLTRWSWQEARDPALLRAHLVRAGVC